MTMQFQINAGHMSTNKLIYSKIIYAANNVRVALRSTVRNVAMVFKRFHFFFIILSHKMYNLNNIRIRSGNILNVTNKFRI